MALTLYEDQNRIMAHMLNLVDSTLTQESYKASVTEFLVWAGQQRYETPAEHVAAYRHYLAEEQSPSTVNRKLTSIRRFFEAAADLGYVSLPTLASVKRIKNVHQAGQKTQRWLTLEEAQTLLDAPPITSSIGLRDRAILAVLLGTALRVSELVNLTWGNVQQEVEGRWIFQNISRKRGRIQSVPVPAWVMERIFDYSDPLPEHEHVFTNITLNGEFGDQLSENGVRHILKKYDEELTPHVCRRTWASLAENGGASLSAISSVLGHANIATTDKYLAKLKPIDNDAINRTGLS
jgi:integrase